MQLIEPDWIFSTLVPSILESARPLLKDCELVTGALANVIPENQFWRWKDMWTNSLRNAVFTAVMVEYLSTRKLLSLADAASSIGSECLP